MVVFACVVGEFVEALEPVKLPLFSFEFTADDPFPLNAF
jgi:hypothetical protein